MRVSKIKYDPSLSIADNATKNQCSENAIRYFIRTRRIDRRFDGRRIIIEDIKKYLQEYPNATPMQVAKDTHHGINTVKGYWDIAHGRAELQPSLPKEEQREKLELARKKKHTQYLDKLSFDFLKEYLDKRKIEERKRLKEQETENKRIAAINEVKSKIDALIEVEHKNTERLSQNKSFLPKVDKKSLYKEEKEQYNAAEHFCVGFRRNEDLWKGMRVPFGNMNGGYSFRMHGIDFPSSEHAYIFGLFSNNIPEHIALQKTLLAEPSGYNAKRGIRNKNKEWVRKDWNEFNIEWMLHCVWNKVNNNKEFRQLLMNIPQGAMIIEDSSFQKISKPFDGPSFWGARNSEKRAFGKLARKYAKSLELKTQKATDDVENKLLWEYCNIGIYQGNNIMGKILTYVKQCLHSGTQPDIDYNLLKSKNIHFLGQPIDFDAIDIKDPIGTNVNTDEVLIKSICGGVFGDISGSTREKSSKSVYTTDFDLFPPKSRPTDDSVLTVAIADWLLHRDTLSLTDALRGWGKKYPRAGFGGGFRNYIKTGIEYNSDKNGAAMRVSPAAVVATSLDEALALAKETAMPSHNSVEGIKGAQAIAASIFIVRDGVKKCKDTSTIKMEVKEYIEQQFGYDLCQSVESIRERSKGYAEMKKTFRATGVPNPEFRQMSEAAVSVPMAIIAFLEGDSYEEVLRIAISLGGDADTIGCMASSISVHLYGIPQTLYDEGCKLIPDDMKNIIDEFDAKYLSNN